ncbi:hypothetical protein L593_02080 [Salinarchaeum sp. Harcht-Bsk1]|nr:hypothetical protein L593_02080 [Salinarchaeum sp. Harcht-Bsk1]
MRVEFVPASSASRTASLGVPIDSVEECSVPTSSRRTTTFLCNAGSVSGSFARSGDWADRRPARYESLAVRALYRLGRGFVAD